MIHKNEDLPGPRFSRWPRSKKKRTERVVRDNFFEGFMEGVNGGHRRPMLCYASTSGLYDYNDCRRIAHEAGYDFAVEILSRRDDRKSGRLFSSTAYKIPASVWAECYAEMRIGA